MKYILAYSNKLHTDFNIEWITIRSGHKIYTCYPGMMVDDINYAFFNFITCKKTEYNIISKYKRLKLQAIMGLYHKRLTLGGKND